MGEHSTGYINELTNILTKLSAAKINSLEQKITTLIGTDRTLFICGNGGSAATASHMACDLGKTILGKQPRLNKNRLRVIALNDATATMTAWGNDEGYEYIFSEQLKSLGRAGDMLIVITGSGNSKNIIQILKVAKKLKIETFGLLGFEGGKAKDLVDESIIIKSSDYGYVEDTHHILVHLITGYLKKQL